MTLSYIPSDTNDEGILKATASGVLPSGQPVIVNADGTVSVIVETVVSDSGGTAAVFESASTSYISAVYDATSGKVVIAYTDAGNAGYGTAIVGTVSGTSISFGTAVVFESAGTAYISATYDTAAGKVVIAYHDQGNSSYGTAIVGTVVGTTISFGTPVVFESADTYHISATYDTASGKVVIAYMDGANSSYGTALTFQVAYTATTLTAENYIGISTGGTYASGSTATVKIIGNTSDEQTSLTAGQAYYVQTDGTLGLTAASPSVFAGTAISATKLLVKT